MKKLIVLFTMLFLAFGFHACEKYIIEIDDVGNVTFAADIQPIFVAKCSSCHPPTGGLDFEDGNVYTTLTTKGLIDTATPENSEVYTKVQGGHGSLATADIQKILKWIELGAKND